MLTASSAQIGNERMTLALEWSKQEEFRNEPLRDWYVDGTVAGMTRSGGGLTYATVRGADHFVSPFRISRSSNTGSLTQRNSQTPTNRPLEALNMLNRWLDGMEL